MDWSKAKTILIIAFLIANSILGYVVYSDYKKEDPVISEEFIEEAKDMLSNKGIELKTDIPTYEPSLVPIIVEYEMINPEDVNKLIFNDMGKIFNEENKILIKYGKKEITIFQNKEFKYKDKTNQLVYEDLNEEKVEKMAIDFIEELGFKRDDMYLDHFSKEKDEYRLIYSKKYEDIYLESAYMDITIDSSGIKSFNRIWLDVKDKGDKEIYLSKAPKAILSLLSKKEAYGKSIKDISICNYFDPLEHDYIETPEDASKGKTIPAWRVLFEDGTRIIIDDY